MAGTVAANVLAHGTGALNIDGCRVEGAARPLIVSDRRAGNEVYGEGLQGSRNDGATSLGRWPANVVLDESQAEELDKQSGESQSRVGKPRGADAGDGWGMTATGARRWCRRRAVRPARRRCRLMRPEDAWGKWGCPLCTEFIAINPYVEGGFLEQQMHIDAHVAASDDYLMGLV